MKEFKTINKKENDTIQLKQLNEKLVGLGQIIYESSENSSNLQRTLNFWTKVMAGAILLQAVLILMQLLK